jgi:ABC-type nitrate/sulfonate/bicarbonate transport system permease component
MKAILWRIAGIAVVALLIWAWQGIADARLVSPVYLPSPTRTYFALMHGFASGDLAVKIFGTIAHMIEGWLVASVAGVALGALIGSSGAARAYIGPMLEFLRPLPASAVIPVAIAIFGLSHAMAIGVIAFGAIWPMLLATIHGFAAVEPRLYEVARVLHLSRAAVIFKIALPSALPDILAGLRLGLTVALILSVICEMIAGLDGLGNWVLLSARMFRSPDLFAGVILLGAIGFAGALALNVAERRLLAWRAGH